MRWRGNDLESKKKKSQSQENEKSFSLVFENELKLNKLDAHHSENLLDFLKSASDSTQVRKYSCKEVQKNCD